MSATTLFTKILSKFDLFSKIPPLDNINFYVFLAKKANCKQLVSQDPFTFFASLPFILA